MNDRAVLTTGQNKNTCLGFIAESRFDDSQAVEAEHMQLDYSDIGLEPGDLFARAPSVTDLGNDFQVWVLPDRVDQGRATSWPWIYNDHPSG